MGADMGLLSTVLGAVRQHFFKLPLVVLLLSTRAPVQKTTPCSKLTASKVLNLRRTARRFAACLSRDRDVDVAAFAAVTDEFMSDVGHLGTFFVRASTDTRQNIRRVSFHRVHLSPGCKG